MKIIGIDGFSATGKTTLSNLISSYSDDIEVIHLDSVLNNTKKIILPKSQIAVIQNEDETNLQFKDNPFNSLPNEILQSGYAICRNAFLSFLVQTRILKLSKQGYQMAIVEGASLSGLNLKCDYIIKTEAPTNLRIPRRAKRDNIDFDLDLLEKCDETTIRLSKKRKLKYDRTVQNVLGLLEMDRIAKEVYEEVSKEVKL